MNINGVQYVIENKNGNKYYYKVINNQKIELTTQELKTLLFDLNKIQEIEKIKQDIINKINSNQLKSIEQVEVYIDSLNIKEYKEQIISDIRKFVTINQIKKYILAQINAKQITNENNLRDFIDKYDIKDIKEKEELLKYGKEELDRINLGLTPIEEFAKFLKEEYQKALALNAMFKIDLKAVDAVTENKYFEISLATERDNQKIEYNKKYYLRFNEETTEKLINPIIREVASKGIVKNEYEKRKDDVINNRYDYTLSSAKECNVNITNVEEFYADKLKKQANDIERQYGKNNGEEISQQIENEYNQELYNEELVKKYTEEELAEMDSMQMSPEEYAKYREQKNTLERELGGPKLVRVKPENKGYANAMPIFVITEFLAVLFILMQIILL